MNTFFHFNQRSRRLWLTMLLVSIAIMLPAQTASYTLSGKVLENSGQGEKGKTVPLPFATVSIDKYGLYAITDEEGNFMLKNVPSGKASLHIAYVGKVPIDTVVVIDRNHTSMSFLMREDGFRLKDVVVTASENKSQLATSSVISRTAMDHMQATSLADVLSLLPGGTTTDPNLNNAKSISIRDIDGTDNAYLGTTIIQDGAPMSNNSNLQSMAPTITGSTSAMGGGASPSSGVDGRSIPTDNIESVEVIRGVPSVEYGDLTKGAVIVHSKAGREPWRFNIKTNKNVTNGSLSKGFAISKEGALNASVDYAYNINNPIESYLHYQRLTGKLLYSDNYLQNHWRSNMSLSLYYGKDSRDQNPDDTSSQIASSGKSIGVTLNANGTFSFGDKDMWLKNVKYVLSGSYTGKKSWYEELYTSANASYSGTTTDGEVLANGYGKHVYDAQGNEITNFGTDTLHKATYLPNSYFGRYDLDGKEINLYGKLNASFFKRLGATDNRLLVGLDFKSDGNEGDGKTFDETTPPYRNLSASNSSQRPRAYKDVPYVNQLGLYAEENFSWNIADHNLRAQLGMRWDHVSVAGSVFSPRANISFDIIPHHLTLRGGYGVTAKAPTLLYLYPEKAYFEYININELADESLDDPYFITTTKVYDAQNRNLSIAKNHKAEIGFDANFGKADFSFTFFSERMDNGYALEKTIDSYKPFTWNEYERNADGELELTSAENVLSSYAMPTNNNVSHSHGIEFNLDIARIDAIRTSFNFNGAWIWSKRYSHNYTFYDESGVGASQRYDVAIYEPKMYRHCTERFVTALRATHNIPSIGLVITATMTTIWRDADWYKIGNDSIPIGYISKDNGQAVFFDPGTYTTRQSVTDAGMDYLLRQVDESYRIKESYHPLFGFNIYVTKEIGRYLRASFFANNVFHNYPLASSRRYVGTQYRRGTSFYFGAELSLTF